MSADGLRFFPNTPLGWLFVGPSFLHFPEQAFTLHLSFQNTDCLFDIVVSYQDLHFVLLTIGDEWQPSAELLGDQLLKLLAGEQTGIGFPVLVWELVDGLIAFARVHRRERVDCV
jgi:hypothetical protein